MNSPSTPDGGRWPSDPRRGDRTANERGGFAPRADDEGWGPSTAVYSASATRGAARSNGGAPTRVGRAFNEPAPARPDRGADTWRPAGPVSSREQRATRAAERRAGSATEGRAGSATEQRAGSASEARASSAADRRASKADRRATHAAPSGQASAASPERGLPWWGALAVLLVIAAIGGVIDTLGSNQIKGGFNVGIVVASVVAILVVKRSHMFPIVIAPPIVYSAAAIFQLYIRSSGLHDKKVVLDAAANYLVYGFPAIAVASAAVLIIAGVRLIVRK